MNIIVAVDKNWAIGKKGQLLVHIPEDMRNFRYLTDGKVIVLGRKTLATFPGERPLIGRKNIILTANDKLNVKDAIMSGSIEEVLEICGQYKDDEVFVVGGARVYEELLPYADTAYVTYIDYAYEADAFFPNLDKSEEWVMTETSDEQTYFDVEYYFRKYERKKSKKY